MAHIIKTTKKITKIYHLSSDDTNSPIATAHATPELAQCSFVSVMTDLPFARAALIYDVSRSDGPLLCGLGFPAVKPVAWDGFISQFDGVRACEGQPPPVAQAVHRVTDMLHQGVSAPLKLTGTHFQHRVWESLLKMPLGESDTYGGLAERLGSHPRAIGGAVGANPLAWLVPCHRILGAGNKLNGYRWGLDIKARMLAQEGVSFLR